MKFDELDSKMREFELARDYKAIPEVFLVARLDGRSFTKLTKEVLPMKRPFDGLFRDGMVATLAHLMDCGFQITFGYTQSDEISLLFARTETTFGRRLRKLISILAGEASAAFSVRLGSCAVFDCKIIELPESHCVVDYFRWRSEDAHRNALNAWCYWTLRDEGIQPLDATRTLDGMNVSEKNEFLFRRGINFNDVPRWQKRGIGMLWETYEKTSVNPKNNMPVVAIRRRLRTDYELPMGIEFDAYVRALVETLQSV
jgi:tRNA(His) guanylyltransferase